MDKKVSPKIIGKIKKIREDELFPVIDLAADKLAAIYKLFGWDINHDWIKKGDEPKNTIDHLIESCLEQLEKGEYTANCSTGGMKVEMMIDEDDRITIEIFFDIAEFYI